MEQITFNPSNEPYYSEDFIKGFKCGAERQFEADKKARQQGEWKAKSFHEVYCDNCGFTFDIMKCDFLENMKICPNCGADMQKERASDD